VFGTTQPRGPAATAYRDGWGLRDISLRPLWAALILALVLHVPALPARFTAWVRLLFWNQPERVDDDGPQQEAVLPIEVDLFDDSATLPDGDAVRPADEDDDEADDDDEGDDDAEPKIERRLVEDTDEELENAFEDEEPDAGAPPPEVADAGAPDAAPEPEVAKADDGARDMEELSKGAIRATQPNVNVYVACDVLRKRDLAKTFGKLLESIPQWNELLGGTGLHPVDHFDRLLISGPQFRNPQWIVVTLRYNVPSPRMKRAVDAVVARSRPSGKWLDDYDLPVAAIGSKAERFVAMVPDRSLLVVVPEDEQELLAQVDAADPFKDAGNEGIVIDLLTPANAFKGGPFEMPETVKRMKVRFTLLGSDDYLVEVEVHDASPEKAAEHMPELAESLESIRVFPPIIGVEIIGEPTYTVDGDIIRARSEVSSTQLDRIMRFASGWLERQAEAAAEAEKKRKAALEKAEKRKAEAEKKRKAREKRLREARKKILAQRRKKAFQQKQRMERQQADEQAATPPKSAPGQTPPPPAPSASPPAEPPAPAPTTAPAPAAPPAENP
jgi:hypothetical protein